jgi:NADH-quinone oxidoreductase subunit C
MNNEALRSTLAASFPQASFEEGTEWITLVIDRNLWKDTAGFIRFTEGLEFDYLFCLTAVDWKTHLTMVYHLSSTLHRHCLVIKSILDRQQPAIASVSDIWRTAEFHEREVYDLFGVQFEQHPDLRRLFMPEDWNGWPLRKDYEDPVNMIKL